MSNSAAQAIYPCFSGRTAQRVGAPVVVDNIPRTLIGRSALHGFGLFATEAIPAGTILCILDGQIIMWDSYNKTLAQSPFGSYSGPLFLEWNALDTETLLVRPFRTKYSYINHSRCPNTVLRRFPLALIAALDLKRGDELTIDYRCEPLSESYLRSAAYL